jgi:cytoskeletal protein CcmA (bactofilin family)
MSEPPSRRLLDKLGASPSLLATRSRVVGDVEVPGALMASGEVIGDGAIGGELYLGPEAHWRGEVRARSAVIAGRLVGSITVSDTIEIAASAVIQGRVSARKIAMARGATIDGEVTVTGTEPIVEFDERRQPT